MKSYRSRFSNVKVEQDRHTRINRQTDATERIMINLSVVCHACSGAGSGMAGRAAAIPI